MAVLNKSTALGAGLVSTIIAAGGMAMIPAEAATDEQTTTTTSTNKEAWPFAPSGQALSAQGIEEDAKKTKGGGTAPGYPASGWTVRNLSKAPKDENTSSVEHLSRQVTENWNGIAGVNAHQFQISVVVVPEDQETMRVEFNDCQGKGSEPEELYEGENAPFVDVPVDLSAKPAEGTDSEIAFVQGDKIWEFWQYEVKDGKPTACWGGVKNLKDDAFPGHTGATASGISYTQTAVSPADIAYAEKTGGGIGHSIFFVAIDTNSDYRWPAQRTDGGESDPAPKQGSRFVLDPDVDLDSLDLTPFAKIVAKTAQENGLVLGDKAGSVSIGTVADDEFWEEYFGEVPDHEQMKNFPWDKLKVVDSGDKGDPCKEGDGESDDKAKDDSTEGDATEPTGDKSEDDAVTKPADGKGAGDKDEDDSAKKDEGKSEDKSDSGKQEPTEPADDEAKDEDKKSDPKPTIPTEDAKDEAEKSNPKQTHPTVPPASATDDATKSAEPTGKSDSDSGDADEQKPSETKTGSTGSPTDDATDSATPADDDKADSDKQGSNDPTEPAEGNDDEATSESDDESTQSECEKSDDESDEGDSVATPTDGDTQDDSTVGDDTSGQEPSEPADSGDSKGDEGFDDGDKDDDSAEGDESDVADDKGEVKIAPSPTAPEDPAEDEGKEPTKPADDKAKDDSAKKDGDKSEDKSDSGKQEPTKPADDSAKKDEQKPGTRHTNW